MFNNIESYLFNEIQTALFEGHNLYCCSVKQLNQLYNNQYTPEAIKNDILDIYLNDVYDAAVFKI